jgi:Flp pilus assembly CpaE family ATPase
MQEVGHAWAARIWARFEAWIAGQPDAWAILADLDTVEAALEESYQGSYVQAAQAAQRLAEVADRGPCAEHLVPLFDQLAEAWTLHGMNGTWGLEA